MLFEDIYKTIATTGKGSFRDRGSKFISFAIPVKDEEEIKEALKGLKKEFYNATHHCYAWLLGSDKLAFRMNDDGEPSGSAGRPILGQIQSKDLTNVLVVVIRYYGGTNLGVPGLINAYKTSAREALDNAQVLEKTVNDIYEIQFHYPHMNDVMRIMKDEKLEQVNHCFQDNCSIVFSVRKNDSARVHDSIVKIDGVKVEYLRTE
ncbi:MAG: YigZ family protein [Bacteroidota bacterium]